ncbi:OmpP1/FadL family transporter [Rhizobiaceae bacterium n13]|uniref:OmpP1/FadL family transporter n=1 Tax=Ferirhizobium litorale TaxID=2927786 RepID=A0AAE3QG63_9HYPH|nr:OmpP1/FadL family transporter [Fererhizobium litorale]MDI7863341.1 OmpP1/FadL family transporter [Fererhizobium litorale]MDI7922925.1 OmpP1/FadL family transporter [Fererhizobium litorale]
MAINKFTKGFVYLVAGTALAGSAVAGGLERGGYNVDLLFDTSKYVFESGVIYVMPNRRLENVQDADGGPGGPTSVDDTENYAIPRVGFKIGFTDAIDCMADYSQPWGGHTNPGVDWAGANNNVETKVNSDNYSATCSYKFDAGPGEFRVIGGGFYQEVDGFQEKLVILPFGFGSGIGRLDLEGNGWGWRAGVAYEIPEYAFRASLVYNSSVDLGDVSGTLDLSQLPTIPPINPLLGQVTPVFANAKMPDVLELKMQTGIAPDWLAFGSVKWADWSQLQAIAVCPTATKGMASCTIGGGTDVTSLDLLYRDGWTINAGVGHKFNDQWSGAVSLTWDRGTSHGYGSQTDSWTLGTGVSYKPTEHIELRFAGALGLWTSGESNPTVLNGEPIGDGVSYSFGNDLIAALSTSLKIRF